MKTNNPAAGSEWYANKELKLRCFVKKDNYELKELLLNNNWIRIKNGSCKGQSKFKSVTKNIMDYIK